MCVGLRCVSFFQLWWNALSGDNTSYVESCAVHVHVHMNTNVNVDVHVHAGGDEHGTQGHHRRLSGDRGPHYPHMIIIVANEKGTLRDQCHRTKKL